MIPHSRPYFDASDVAAVQQVVTSAYTACGSKATELERLVQHKLGMPAAVAIDSGTSALMLAIRALKLTQSIIRVGIPAYACASLLFAVRAAGCEPVAMDCGTDLRLDEEKAIELEASLDAVIVVHPFGMVEPLVQRQWSCPMIEDIAQAAGASLDGRAVGSFGDISIVSFYATKPWGGAYGGMLMADELICTQVRAMINPDQADFRQAYVGHHQLSDVHAALALCHIQKSQGESQQRAQQFAWLDNILPKPYVESISRRYQGNMFRYIIRQPNGADALIHALREHGVCAEKPVQIPYDTALGEACSGAQQAWKDCVSLPVLTHMSEREQQVYEQGLKVCCQ